MTVDLVIGLAAEAVKVTLLLAAPMLTVGLGVGLIVSIFQAVTQIQEMTLTFVPKIVAVMVALIIALPWMIHGGPHHSASLDDQSHRYLYTESLYQYSDVYKVRDQGSGVGGQEKKYAFPCKSVGTSHSRSLTPL